MKLFVAAWAATVTADFTGCIIAPGSAGDPRQKLVGTSYGPIWKKMTSCTVDPKETEDGQFWFIPVGAKCSKVFCNLKTGGSVTKYREFTCSGENQIDVIDWFKNEWTFIASPRHYLCPTVGAAGCQWNEDSSAKFVMPMTEDQMGAAAHSALNGNTDTCNRQAHVGWDAGDKFAKDAMVDVAGGLFMFQKRKFDIYCDKFYADKKDPSKYKTKPRMKSGTKATCLCDSKASGGDLKKMYAEIAGTTVTSLPFKPLNCEFKASNRLFGKEDNVYDLGKKGQCDDGYFVKEATGPFYIRDKNTRCCQDGKCPEHSQCSEFGRDSEFAYQTSEGSPFWGSGAACECDPGYGFNEFGTVCVQRDPCLINHGGCHEKADCSSQLLEDGSTPHQCRCKPGYVGDGIKCVPESCQVDNGWCHQNADCSQEDDGSFSCECQTHNWFVGDGHGDFGCKFDPCGLGFCDPNATCDIEWDEMTAISWGCDCNGGYFGDGRTCAHVCTSNNGGCSVNADCSEVEGGHECDCINGFEGDGVNCHCSDGKGVVTIDGIDGCYDEHPEILCFENEIWSWSSNECICEQGFEHGDGQAFEEDSGDEVFTTTSPATTTAPGTSSTFTPPSTPSATPPRCVDINECQVRTFPSTVDCHNTIGGYTLSCMDGYFHVEGTDIEIDGCANINECETGAHACNCPMTCFGFGVCPPPCDVKCEDNDGDYNCHCSEGYIIGDENGVTCEDDNECLKGTHNCEDGEACVNEVGTYSCTCATGWEIDDSIACDECKFGFDNCHEEAMCLDEEVGFSCECNFGWSDTFHNANGTDCTQDGDWLPLPVKKFEEGLSDALRSGVQNEAERAAQWPELPSDYGCAPKPWDRNHEGYIELFNSLIKKNKKSYKGPNIKADDWVEQVSFPVPETTWSWGTWGTWGEWSKTCTRKENTCSNKNNGWQTRERVCLVNGVQACSSWCMPVDDMGLTPMMSDRKKYPFTNRIDRVTEVNKDLWWTDPVTGKKVKSYTWEEPFNPYIEGDENPLFEAHKEQYNECRTTGSFLLSAASIPTEKDENGEWIKDWSSEHPADYMESRKKATDGEKFICTHQWRRCEEVAEWVHDSADQTVASGWSEWSECFAENEGDECMNSGHKLGNFAAPYTLETHHYQQRTRRCSTGCYVDCLNIEDDATFQPFDSQQSFLAWRKVGDKNPNWATRKAVMWRACHHRPLSYGCSLAPFAGWKSYTNLASRCSFEGIKGFVRAQAGMMAEGTICNDVYSSMNPIDKAPFWDTRSVPNTSEDSVDITCVCEGGCNACEWKITSPPKVLGKTQELPPVSHANGLMVNYNFAPAVKHKWDTNWPEVESKAVRFWDEGTFPAEELYNTRSQGEYMCIGSKLKSKWQFGSMFNSPYHRILYNPARDNEWYNWDQFMCRPALRFGTVYEYFTEEHFQVLQVEDKSKIEWVEANNFLTGDHDVSQIITAADADMMDGNEDESGEVEYADDKWNWRIYGACRIAKKCTKTMVKQFANGKIEAPCKYVDQIYNVRMGSLRMYEMGMYASSGVNATAPNFCCKDINFLHWAEPHLWQADQGIVFDEDKSLDETRMSLREDPLSPMLQMISQDKRNHDRGIVPPDADIVIDDHKRVCYNHHIQIMTYKDRPSVTHWSAWSECSVSCGTELEDGTFEGGIQSRKRVPINWKFDSNGLHEPSYKNQEPETETRTCHDFACHTTHWGTWGEWGKCSKNKKDNSQKWSKRRRVCMYQGRPLDDVKAEGLIDKKTNTMEKENCPKEDWEEWKCCCEETECKRKNGSSMCPWEPEFAKYRPV